MTTSNDYQPDEMKSNTKTSYHLNKTKMRKEADDEDIDVPLIFRTNKTSTPFSPLEMEKSNYNTSATTFTNATTASSSKSWMAAPFLYGRIILIMFVLLMIIIIALRREWHRRSFQEPESSHERTPLNNTTMFFFHPDQWPSDDSTCARKEYHVNFSSLFHDQRTMETDQEASRCVARVDTATNTTAECYCDNPTLPHEPIALDDSEWANLWHLSLARNLEMVRQYQQQQQQTPLDVVLLGDSITERWVGTELTEPLSENGPEYQRMFQALFSKKSSSVKGPPPTKSQIVQKPPQPFGKSVRGMALGIAGDQTTHLLYRLQHGELATPEHYPKVWWVLIGINNLNYESCTKESVLVGLIRIIQELQWHQEQKFQQDKSHRNVPWIVINSILPLAADDDRTQLHPLLWPSIQWINHRVECYLQGLERVAFFNATSLFVTTSSTGQHTIDPLLLPDGLHPSPKGQWKWGTRIVETVQELIQRGGDDGDASS